MTPRKNPRVKTTPPPPTPPKSELWDLPQNPEHGDADPIVIFTSVGRALSKWERLEQQMSNIFAALMSGKRDHDAARWAYGMCLSSKTRADMLDGAAFIFFYVVPDREPGSGGVPGLKAEYAIIMRAFNGFAARRNNIAHGIVSPYFPTRPQQDGHCLVPPLYASKQYRKKFIYPYALTAAMIDGYADHFDNLANSAMMFSSQLKNVVPY